MGINESILEVGFWTMADTLDPGTCRPVTLNKQIVTKYVDIMSLLLHDSFKSPSVELANEAGKSANSKYLWHYLFAELL